MTRGGTVALLSNASSRRLLLVTFALSLALVWGAAAVPAAEARKPKRVEVPAAAAAVIEAASQYLGLPYRLGTEGPDRFDCSGLIFRAFADAGHRRPAHPSGGLHALVRRARPVHERPVGAAAG